MAILNYGNQFRYSGKGYLDSKVAPVNSVDELETSKSVLSSYYSPGMKVTVLNDGDFGAVDYFLNDNYEWKRAINLDNLTLSLDKGNYNGEEGDEMYLQIHYTNANGDLVALGDTIDLSVILDDVEARIEALENKGSDTPIVEDTNTFVENASIVTEKEGENGLFIKFDYNDGNSFYLDITALEPKTYANGIGILIGEDNVISIDEAWFNQWFDAKVVELTSRIETLETNVASLSTALSTIAKDVDEQKNNFSTLSSQLAMIKGVDYLKAGDNVKLTTDEQGYVTISADQNVCVKADDITTVKNEDGSLSVMISKINANAIKKNTDGLFVQSLEIVCGDEEINEEDNN